ncbi:MAG: hypothetical protein AAGI13_11455 [Pseudomonadota bacterium]
MRGRPKIHRLSEREIRACLHPDERMRFILALVFVLIGLILIAAGMVINWVEPFFSMPLEGAIIQSVIRILGLLFGLLSFYVLLWIGTLFLRARLRAYAAEVNDTSLPEIEEVLSQVCLSLDYPRRSIEAFLIEQKIYGIGMLRSWRGRFLIVTSEIAESVYDYDAPGELAFFIASHVGAIRARMLRTAFIARCSLVIAGIPVLGFFIRPYLRATVYSADRLALRVTDDLQAALDAVAARITGKDLASMVALTAWIEQHQALRYSFISFLIRMPSAEPHPVDRIANLLCYALFEMPDQYLALVRGMPDAKRRHLEEMLSASRHAVV